MTREQIKAILPEGAEDSVVTKLLDALHAEISPYKEAAKKANEDLAAKVSEMAEISKKAATAEEKAKQYDELHAKYEADMKAANERAAAMEFDGELEGVLRDKGCRNMKAARALLDMETLKSSQNRKADIVAAVDALTGAEDSSMLFAATPAGKTNVGAPTGAPTGAPVSGVESAFMRLNPDLKIN